MQAQNPDTPHAAQSLSPEEETEQQRIFRMVKYHVNNDELQIYINSGKPLDVRNERYETLLHVAADHGNLDGVKMLVAAGANIEAEASKFRGNTALMTTVIAQYQTNRDPPPQGPGYAYYEIVKHLLEKGAKCQFNRKNPLSYATKAADVDMTRLLIDYHANVNKQPHATAPLAYACYDSNLAEKRANIVNLLIPAGAEINALDHEGVTALMTAASSGLKDIVNMLVNAGAQIDRQDNIGETALIKAANEGHIGTTKTLVALGADLDIEDNAHLTAYTHAERQGKTEICNFIKQIRKQYIRFDEHIREITREAASREELDAFHHMLRRELSVAYRRNPSDEAIRGENAHIAKNPSLKEYYLALQATLNEAFSAILAIHSGMIANDDRTITQSIVRTSIKFLGYAAGFFPFAASIAPIINEQVVDPIIALDQVRKINRASSLIPGGSSESLAEIVSMVSRTLALGIEDHLEDFARDNESNAVTSWFSRQHDWLTANQLTSTYQRLGTAHALALLQMAKAGQLTTRSLKSAADLLPLFSPEIDIPTFELTRRNIATTVSESSSATDYLTLDDIHSDLRSFDQQLTALRQAAIGLAFTDHDALLINLSALVKSAKELAELGEDMTAADRELDYIHNEILIPVVNFKRWTPPFKSAVAVVNSSVPNAKAHEFTTSAYTLTCCFATSIPRGLKAGKWLQPSQVSGETMLAFMLKNKLLTGEKEDLNFIKSKLSTTITAAP